MNPNPLPQTGGATPLYVAACRDDVVVLSALLDAGANADAELVRTALATYQTAALFAFPRCNCQPEPGCSLPPPPPPHARQTKIRH